MRNSLFFLFLAFTLNASSDPYVRSPKKSNFYVYWGYNHGFYSKTNLHFSGPAYDFTLYDLTGSDRPEPFTLDYLDPVKLSVPQFNFRLGYFLTNSIAISVGIDHMKYIVDQYQKTTISGVVSSAASEQYAGSYLLEPIELKPDVLMFEHTNGFNLINIDLEYLRFLFNIPKAKISAYMNMGFGGVWVVTKTDVRVFGDGLNNDFKVAGYSLTGKAGPRIEYNNRFFLSGELRGGYASLPSVPIKNSAPEMADHNLFFGEYYIVAGVNFNLRSNK